MNKFTDFLVAVLLVAGILTAWVLVPVIGVLVGTGLLIIFFYYMARDYRESKHQPQHQEPNSPDQSGSD